MIQRIVLLMAVCAVGQAASITVAPTVTTVGVDYHYAYSITNPTADDSFLIDISVPTGTGVVLNLTAAPGFQATVDTNLGLVSFLENTSYFGSVPQGGFSFDSLDKPGAAGFQATVLSATTGSVYTVNGQTVAPSAVVASPEPGYLPLFALLVPVLFIVVRHRRSQQAV